MNLFTKKLFLVLIFFLLIAFFLPESAYAATNFDSGNSVILAKDETITTDYYASGATVIINGTINGDAYVAGGSIIVNGTVLGDVLAAGGNISIGGKVTGNVRAVGGQIIITGEIDRNVSVAGGSISIQPPALVAGSVTAAAGNLSLLAPIGKGAVITGSQATINNSIGGDTRIAADQLDILQDAKIEGELAYWSPNQAHIVPFTIKNGAVYHHTDWKTPKTQQAISNNLAKAIAGFGLTWIVVSFAASFFVGLVFMNLAPFYIKNVVTTITQHPWRSFGVGFIFVVLVPFAFFVLLATVIGIPFAFLLIITFVIFALLNQIFIALAIGKRLLPTRNGVALFVGLIIYSAINAIPLINWMFSSITLFIGMGAITIVSRNLYITLRAKKII
ncbi:MAG: hypothetical protein Q7T54_00505 [Candidatus Levybacteria bacterium]|nr:hypothetical protein [Candidatus Levybacteria bacterium]